MQRSQSISDFSEKTDTIPLSELSHDTAIKALTNSLIACSTNAVTTTVYDIKKNETIALNVNPVRTVALPDGRSYAAVTVNHIQLQSDEAKAVSYPLVYEHDISRMLINAKASADGRYLAALVNTTQRGIIFLLDIEAGRLQPISCPGTFFENLFFSSSGCLLLVGQIAHLHNGEKTGLYLVDPQKPTPLVEFTSVGDPLGLSVSEKTDALINQSGINTVVEQVVEWNDRYCLTQHGYLHYPHDPGSALALWKMTEGHQLTAVEFKHQEKLTYPALVDRKNSPNPSVEKVGMNSFIFSQGGHIKMLMIDAQGQIQTVTGFAPKNSRWVVFPDGRVGFYGGENPASELVIHTFRHIQQERQAQLDQFVDQHLAPTLGGILPRGVLKVTAGYYSLFQAPLPTASAIQTSQLLDYLPSVAV